MFYQYWHTGSVDATKTANATYRVCLNTELIQADDCLVVTNMLAVEETIDGKRLLAKSFAHLRVWKQN